MKRIQNKRSFFTAVLTGILAVICLAVTIYQNQAGRFLLAGVIALAWCAVSLYTAFARPDAAELATAAADERDRYIARKSSQAALRLFSYFLDGGCIICLCLYGIFKAPAFLTVAITLCALLVLLFFTVLLTNRYYEKRE